ncbi:MAG: hypothetical protein IJ039_03165 [Clostridia bacterium]|nr:hypothetical protein [Clostridia bacterium]
MAKIISNVKKGATTVARNVKRKSKRFAEIAKLKLDIKMEESNLEQCFEMLGRASYAKACGSDNQNKIDELVAQANRINGLIKEYKSRLAFLQDKEICEHCESVIDRDTPCQYCKEKIVAGKKTADTVDENE